MDTMIHKLAQAMQTLLTQQADKAVKDSKFVQRKSPLGGAAFVQACVFACMEKPLPTLDDFVSKAAAAGVVVQPQAFDQRFTPQAAECLRLVLVEAIKHVVVSQPPLAPLLRRFPALLIQDSSTVVLPDCLEHLWRGNGGRTDNNTKSAIKIQVRLDMRSGMLTGPFLEHGRCSDQSSPVQGDVLPEGALRIADLGYADLSVFRKIQEGKAFWLSRLPAKTAVFTLAKDRLDLVRWLIEQDKDVVDTQVLLGADEQLQARLVAVRVPPWVTEQRRKKLHQEAAKKGKKVSVLRLALCAWTLLVTNLTLELASVAEMVVLARCRWQIELLFKAWKSDGGLDKSGTQKPYRVLCEVYAKLIALVIKHWLVVACCWDQPRVSLRKSLRRVSSMALVFAGVLANRPVLEVVLQVVHRALASGNRLHKSAKDPRTYQILQQPELCASSYFPPDKS